MIKKPIRNSSVYFIDYDEKRKHHIITMGGISELFKGAFYKNRNEIIAVEINNYFHRNIKDIYSSFEDAFKDLPRAIKDDIKIAEKGIKTLCKKIHLYKKQLKKLEKK